MRYLVAEYKTGLDFAKGMLKLKKENSGFMEQTISAIKGSDLVMYGTCGAFAYQAAELLGIPCANLRKKTSWFFKGGTRMDKITHEVRLAQWDEIVRQCQARPALGLHSSG